jgi:hypothetical protein
VSDLLKQRMNFMEAFDRRTDIQLLAVVIKLCWPGAQKAKLSNADFLAIAENELIAMAAQDSIEQEKAEHDLRDEMKVDRLMRQVNKGKPH